MKCTVCGGELNRTMTDLPFKIGEQGDAAGRRFTATALFPDVSRRHFVCA